MLRADAENVTTATAALESFDDARMTATWKLVANGEEMMSLPRVAFLRNVLLNHIYPHRGQFGVYLRLLGATVPSAYGPSGDEVPPEFQKIVEMMAAGT